MPKPESYYDINALPLEAEIITCPNCGNGHALEFRPMAWSVWCQCPCGRGWEILNSNVSREVN